MKTLREVLATQGSNNVSIGCGRGEFKGNGYIYIGPADSEELQKALDQNKTNLDVEVIDIFKRLTVPGIAIIIAAVQFKRCDGGSTGGVKALSDPIARAIKSDADRLKKKLPESTIKRIISLADKYVFDDTLLCNRKERNKVHNEIVDLAGDMYENSGDAELMELLYCLRTSSEKQLWVITTIDGTVYKIDANNKADAIKEVLKITKSFHYTKDDIIDIITPEWAENKWYKN